MSQSCKFDVRQEDFFKVSAPPSAIARALQGASVRRGCSAAFILALQREDRSLGDVRLNGEAVGVIPFPVAAKGLVEIAQDPNDYGEDAGEISLYLPRAAFDKVADRHGARRISGLSLRPGCGRNDLVMTNLAACLTTETASSGGVVVDQIALALNAHLAQRYGGMQIPTRARNGCLTPWQLRLARDRLDQNLDNALPLAQVAHDCGLSLSHFSRAFAQSTGLPPHRWIVQRRVELAKDLIRRGEAPLVEIALACGFADQSHLTRAFSKATGSAPARWRKSQASAARGLQTSSRDAGGQALTVGTL